MCARIQAKEHHKWHIPCEDLDLNDKKTQAYINHLYKDENFHQFTVRRMLALAALQMARFVLMLRLVAPPG